MKSFYHSIALVVLVLLGASVSSCNGFAPPAASNSHLFGQKKAFCGSSTNKIEETSSSALGIAGGVVHSPLTIDGATVGKLFDIVRRAVGLIPGAAMIFYNETLEKAAQRLKIATMKIDQAKVSTAETALAAAPTKVTTDAIVVNQATSDNWPLMGKKHVAFRASMTDAKAAKIAGEKYAQIENLEDRAFQILLDLGMVEER